MSYVLSGNGQTVTGFTGSPTSLTIPEGVTSIHSGSFFGCSSLTTIILPTTLLYIRNLAFAQCTNLTSITIPSSVSYIGDFTFSECSSLTTVSYYDTANLGRNVFNACPLLSPANGTVLTFNGNGQSTPTISVPPTASPILVGQTLANSTLAEGVAIDPSSQEVLSGTFAFTSPSTVYSNAGSSNVSVTFTPDNRTVYSTVTVDVSCNIQLPYILSNDGLTVTGHNGNPTTIVLPAGIQHIGASAFTRPYVGGQYISRNLTSITIPEGVTSIGNYAFSYCQQLPSITLPSTLLSIGNDAFAQCRFTSITIPSNVTTMGSGVFQSNGLLETVTLPRSVTYINSYTFAWCASLSSLTCYEGTNFSAPSIFVLSGISQPTTVLSSKTTPTLSALSATSVNALQTLANSTLSGTPSVAGTLAFTNPSQVLRIGSNSVGVTFTPTNTTLYNNATATVNVAMTAVPPNTDTSVTKTINSSPVTLTARSVSVTTNATSYTPTNTSLPSVAVASLPATVRSMTIAVSPPVSNAVALVLNAYDGEGVAVTTFASPATFTVTIPGLTTPTATVNTYNTDGSVKSTAVATNTSGSTYTFQLSHLCDVTITGITPNNVRCFPTGVQIKTASGSVRVEELATGDLVLTADGRQVPIKVYSTTVVTTETTAPYLIPKNSLGPQMPVADLHLSPLHAFQLKKGLWQIPRYASKLTERVCQYGVGETVTYYHLECPNFFTDNLVADGCIVESFGDKQIAGLKTLYKYNPGLKGFTRASGLNRVLRA